MDYLLPFLIIICLGIIVVLVFNLWKALFVKENDKAAYLHLVEGTLEMNAWSTDQYFDIASDTLIVTGDSLRTSADALAIVEFFDGTIMRISGGSDLIFESIEDDSKNPNLEITLRDGKLWFNKLYRNTHDTEVTINTANLVVRSESGGIFEVGSDDLETVRLLSEFDDDGLLVDIKNQDSSSVVDTQKIAVGQQAVFSKDVLTRFWSHQSPNFLKGLDTEFQQTKWYIWNLEEDEKPTVIEKSAGISQVGLLKAEPQIVENDELSESDVLVDDISPDKIDKDDSANGPTDLPASQSNDGKNVLNKPIIFSVGGVKEADANGFYNVTGKVVTLEGGITGADKVVVNGYTLQKFKPGDGKWTYFANADFGLIKEGENTFEIYGIDSTGKKSESLIIKVIYKAAVEDAPSPIPEPTQEPVSKPQTAPATETSPTSLQ